MTTAIVPSISDEQLAELAECYMDSVPCPISALYELANRLLAAKAYVERLNKLDALCEAYGCEGIHEGNRWMIDGPYRDIRAAIDDIKPAMGLQP